MYNWLKVLVVVTIGLYILALYSASPVYYRKNPAIIIREYKIKGCENLYLVYYKNKITDIEKLGIAIKIKF